MLGIGEAGGIDRGGKGFQICSEREEGRARGRILSD